VSSCSLESGARSDAGYARKSAEPGLVSLVLAAVWVWSFDPLQLLALALGAAMYARRAHMLARRGRPLAVWRQFAFYGGLGVILLALVSPIDHMGEERLFFVHMVQHILLGDLGALLIVLGLTGPVLRPVLALPAVGRLRVLAHPLVALPLWAIDLYLWHLPPVYQAALEYEVVHAVEHLSFFGFGALMWAALLEPLPGPAWFGTGAKVLYVAVVRLLEAVLANFFLWSGAVFYPRYAEAERLRGISPLADQNLAGAVMLIEGSIVTLGAFAWIFLRWMADGELRQELVEHGVDERVAARAVRYGRGRELERALQEEVTG
jgi:putative membrane protein